MLKSTMTGLAALALLVAPAVVGPAVGEARIAVAQGATIPVTIRTVRGKQLRYRAEVARTPQEQALGLMHRTALPKRGGMIFPMSPPRPVGFWMKNTLIPLDMIFIRADGTIAMIAENTVPHDLNPIGPGEPMAAVLELAGGQARRDGLRVGDRVSWRG